MIVKTFAFFGFTVAALALCGSLGIGHFYGYYGQHPVQCVKGQP